MPLEVGPRNLLSTLSGQLQVQIRMPLRVCIESLEDASGIPFLLAICFLREEPFSQPKININFYAFYLQKQ